MHDAIVIGAGPGGAMAAQRLGKAGARVLILEAKTLPRDKACGGALVIGPAQQPLAWDVSSQIKARLTTCRLQFDFERALEIPFAVGAGMVNRREFDACLVERAVNDGQGAVTLRDGFAIATIEETNDGVTVVGKRGERCRAHFLVGADGATGPTAASVGMARRSRAGVAIDAEVHVDAEVFAREAGRMSVNFGVLPGGYGWIFPKDGYLSCGVASWTSGAGLQARLDAYLARALPAGSVFRQTRRGHLIPVYDGPARISTRRVCLVGDAASLVDPILGEGIRFAMHSGVIAGDVIANYLADAQPADDGLDYTRLVHATFGAALERLRRFIVPTFVKNPSAFYRTFFEERRDYFAVSRALDACLPGGDVTFD
jgi:geranylgeranyl reductase family protein